MQVNCMERRPLIKAVDDYIMAFYLDAMFIMSSFEQQWYVQLVKALGTIAVLLVYGIYGLVVYHECVC